MEAVLMQAQNMILNQFSVKLDNHSKPLLCKVLRFAPALTWSIGKKR